jgi:hypothetical protein
MRATGGGVAQPGLTPAAEGNTGPTRNRTAVRPQSPLKRRSSCNDGNRKSAIAQVPAFPEIAVSVTRKRKDGRTEWIPPPDLDTGQGRVNKHHHPEELLRRDDETCDQDDETT